MKTILLTFDLEEFDLPREFNQEISEEEMYKISKKGMDKLIFLLENQNVKATFFTTANFAKKFPNFLKQLSQKGHEIACHGYSHSDCYTDDTSRIPLAKREIERIILKEVKGFRAPKWYLGGIEAIQKEFYYDSSSHPIYLPGRYFNINKKRKAHKIGDLIEIPLSTLPPNLSIFWLAFKNFPLLYSRLFTRVNFFTINYTMLVMHPWEFSDISKFKLPWYVNTIYGKKLLKKLGDYIAFCKRNNYQFRTTSEFIENQVL